MLDYVTISSIFAIFVEEMLVSINEEACIYWHIESLVSWCVCVCVYAGLFVIQSH